MTEILKSIYKKKNSESKTKTICQPRTYFHPYPENRKANEEREQLNNHCLTRSHSQLSNRK
jgi:hypothetical protein